MDDVPTRQRIVENVQLLTGVAHLRATDLAEWFGVSRQGVYQKLHRHAFSFDDLDVLAARLRVPPQLVAFGTDVELHRWLADHKAAHGRYPWETDNPPGYFQPHLFGDWPAAGFRHRAA